MADLILPQPGEPVVDGNRLLTRFWLQLMGAMVGRINSPRLPVYTVATMPSPAAEGLLIYVSNAAGGAVVAFSDGTNWRRVTDRAVVT